MTEAWRTRKKRSMQSRGAGATAETTTGRKGREKEGRRNLVARSEEQWVAQSFLQDGEARFSESL